MRQKKETSEHQTAETEIENERKSLNRNTGKTAHSHTSLSEDHTMEKKTTTTHHKEYCVRAHEETNDHLSSNLRKENFCSLQPTARVKNGITLLVAAEQRKI